MAGVRLDATDLRILDAIQRDGRITKLKLADMVGLSPTPCWMRLRKLQEAGIVSELARGEGRPRARSPGTPARRRSAASTTTSTAS